MTDDRGFIGFEFEKVRETRWPVIAGFFVAVALFTSVVNLVVFPSNAFLRLAQATAGLVQSTLIVNLIGLVIIVIGIIIYAGKLRKGDVGIRFSLLPQAILTTLCLWAAIQLIGLGINVVSGGGLALDSVWQERRWTVVLGAFIAQLFGNSLLEEIEYRGFLLPQFFLKFKGLAFHRNLRIAAAIVASQLVFSLSHVANRLYQGVPFSEWPLGFFTLLGIGVLFAFIYLRTGNLFIAVGVHSLADSPVSLFISQAAAGNMALALGLILILVWRKWWSYTSTGNHL
jgi:membrane protease YdiL (CAAX protease family)